MSQSNITQTFKFDPIDAALADLKAGRVIVVVDDENRENEGDLICAAQFATPDMINFMAVEARGLICLAMTGDRLDELDLPLMVSKLTDTNQTAFTVSIDAGPHLGVSTGISAEDRARTIQVTLNPATKASKGQPKHRPSQKSESGHPPATKAGPFCRANPGAMRKERCPQRSASARTPPTAYRCQSSSCCLLFLGCRAAATATAKSFEEVA